MSEWNVADGGNLWTDRMEQRTGRRGEPALLS